MNFKNLAAAAALTLTALSASAATATPMTVEGPAEWSFTSLISGPTMMDWTFDPTDGFTYDTAGAAFSFSFIGNVAISGLTLDGKAFQKIGSTWLYNGVVDDSVHTVSVTTSGTGSGVYTGAVALSNATAVTPVPEPETYAMLLAGLGAVGFMSRRRKVSAV